MTRLYLRSSVAAGHPGARGDGLDKRLLQAAEEGDAHAQCNLGILYSNGLDDNEHAVEGKKSEAVKWLLAAADQGLLYAQLRLAEVYADKPDIAGSHTIACGWFLLAAKRLRGIHLHRRETPTKDVRNERLVCSPDHHSLSDCSDGPDLWVPRLFSLNSE